MSRVNPEVVLGFLIALLIVAVFAYVGGFYAGSGHERTQFCAAEGGQMVDGTCLIIEREVDLP